MSVDVSTTKWIIIASICLLIAAVMTGVNECVTKVSNFTVIQLTTIRWSIQLIIALLWWNIKKPTSPFLFTSQHLDTSNINRWYGDNGYVWNIWARGVLYGIYAPTYWYGVITLPLGDFICIHFLSPLLIVYIAHFVLKEKLPKLCILIPSTILTITGLLLVTQPQFIIIIIDPNSKFHPLDTGGLISALIASCCYVSIVLLARTAINVHFIQLEIAGSSCSIIIGTGLTLLINVYLRSPLMGDLNFNLWHLNYQQYLILFFVSCNGFGFILFSVVGYQLGDATLVGWLEYIQIPISFSYQTFIFNDVPNKYEIIGSTAIAIGCLLPAFQQIHIYFAKKQYQQIPIESDNEFNSDISTEIEAIV